MARRGRLAGGIVVVVAILLLLLGGRVLVRERAASKPAPEPSNAAIDPRGDPPTRAHPRALAEDDDAHEPREPGETKHRALPAQTRPDSSPHGALVGRVSNWSTREPVADAELGFVQAGVTHTVATDERGGYRFAPPSPGVWELATLTAEGYLPYAPELGNGNVRFVARPRARIERADLFLFPALDYVGRVVDGEGRPVVGAQIELFGADSGERALIGLESSFRSDADGEFVFHAPDFAVLEARHADHPPGRASLDAAAQISHTLTITLGRGASEAGEPITGELVGMDERAIEGVEIRAEPGPGVGSLVRTPSATPDADGRFTLAPLDQNAYVVVAHIPGHVRLTSEVVEPGAHVRLVVDSGFTLAGRLVDEHGQAIPTGTVAVLAVDGLARRPLASASVFDAHGEFEFTGLRAGEVEVQAIAQGYAAADPVRLELPRDAPVEIELRAGAYVHGHVFDAQTHEPLPLALVSAAGLGAGHSVLPSLSSTVTDEHGAFELYGVDPVRTSLEAAAFAHDAMTLSGLELDPDRENGPIDFELHPVAEGERPKQEITGIGVEIAPATDAILINNVIEGGGAEEAGIVAGDQITAVDGATVTELGFADAVQNIRGQAGTKVKLDLTRTNGTKTQLEVKRRRIQY